jgi:hypothetical protein
MILACHCGIQMVESYSCTTDSFTCYIHTDCGEAAHSMSKLNEVTLIKIAVSLVCMTHKDKEVTVENACTLTSLMLVNGTSAHKSISLKRRLVDVIGDQVEVKTKR